MLFEKTAVYGNGMRRDITVWGISEYTHSCLLYLLLVLKRNVLIVPIKLRQ